MGGWKIKGWEVGRLESSRKRSNVARYVHKLSNLQTFKRKHGFCFTRGTDAKDAAILLRFKPMGAVARDLHRAVLLS